MIVVIADDLTGAAELAGIGLRYNLATELFMSSIQTGDTDVSLFVVCTDSRSMNKENARSVSDRVAKEVRLMAPDRVYKKIDSVFRGHVLDELKAEMRQLGLKKALIIGANPSLGRTIRAGKYFINGELISETDFGTDPEFAITDSSVLRMLRAGTDQVTLAKPADDLPEEGIVVGEAESREDIIAWTKQIDNSWLLAGAGDFFTALLDREFTSSQKPAISTGLPHLYVSGTAFGKSREFVKSIKQNLGCVAYLTPTMMETGKIDSEAWYEKVLKMFSDHEKAVIAINDEEVNPWNVSPVFLRTIMARVVRTILEKRTIGELFIEGGSTAAAILNELGIKKLSAVNELQRGVVRMKANNMYITVKPGSYELPGEIKRLYND
jgi:uncharacterized protein YgbK (DUF1537 family)